MRTLSLAEKTGWWSPSMRTCTGTLKSFPVSSGVKHGCISTPTLLGIFSIQYAFADCTVGHSGLYICTRAGREAPQHGSPAFKKQGQEDLYRWVPVHRRRSDDIFHRGWTPRPRQSSIPRLQGVKVRPSAWRRPTSWARTQTPPLSSTWIAGP